MNIKPSLLMMFLLALACVFVNKKVEAQTYSHDIQSLRGLKSVCVKTLIYDNGLLTSNSTLTSSQITKDAELLLKKNGITIKPYPTYLVDYDCVYLYIEIDAKSANVSDPSKLVYRVHIGGSQSTSLMRENTVASYAPAETWYGDAYGIVDKSKVASLRTEVDTLLRDFCQCYLKAQKVKTKV